MKLSLSREVAARVLALIFCAPVGSALAADLTNGQRLYGTHCAICHGVRGQPVMPQAPAFNRGERLMQPDLNLLASIRNGRNAMPGFVGMLSDRDILDVITFLRFLQ